MPEAPLELASILDWLTPTLGFASATLVAVIALGFAALFVFFSGASLLVLGKFLPFARSPRAGLPAIVLGAIAYYGLSRTLELEPAWGLSRLGVVFGVLVYGLLVAGVSRRVLWLGGAGVLLGTALAYPFAVLVPGVEVWAAHDAPLPLALRWGGGTLALGVWALQVWALRDRIGARWAGLGMGAGLTLLSAGAGLPQVLVIPSFVPWLVLLAAGYALGVLLGLGPMVLAGLVRHRIEKPVEWFISLRYLVAKRRQTFISVISVICVTGVALGVAVITVVLSVMNGFSRVWEDKILGTRAHFIVQSREGAYPDYLAVRDEVLTVPGVTGATPFIEAEAILRGDRGELEAILLKGIDTATVSEATQLRADMIEGSLEMLDPEVTGDAALPGIVLGVELADRYFLRPGDPVILISPMGGPSTPLGPAPRMARFRVAGIFKSNFFQFDERFAYASLAAVQDFMKVGDVVSGVEVRTTDPYRSQAVAFDVERALGGLYFARDWKTFYPGFFNALKTERVMMFVLLSFIMVVAGFIIIATLIMMIMEKSRDIAILKTMGCDDQGILRVFAIQGFLIGIGGLALGLGMGLVITWNLDVVQGTVERLLGIDVLPANVYQLQQLPYDIVPWHLVLISLIAMVLSIGATFLPSWQAARLDPAEALRFE